MLSIQQHQLFIKGFLCYGMPHAIDSCCFRFMFLICRGYELTDDDRTISTTSIFATYISIYGCLDSYHPVADTNTFPLQIHIFFLPNKSKLIKTLGWYATKFCPRTAYISGKCRFPSLYLFNINSVYSTSIKHMQADIYKYAYTYANMCVSSIDHQKCFEVSEYRFFFTYSFAEFVIVDQKIYIRTRRHLNRRLQWMGITTEW